MRDGGRRADCGAGRGGGKVRWGGADCSSVAMGGTVHWARQGGCASDEDCREVRAQEAMADSDPTTTRTRREHVTEPHHSAPERPPLDGGLVNTCRLLRRWARAQPAHSPRRDKRAMCVCHHLQAMTRAPWSSGGLDSTGVGLRADSQMRTISRSRVARTVCHHLQTGASPPNCFH